MDPTAEFVPPGQAEELQRPNTERPAEDHGGVAASALESGAATGTDDLTEQFHRLVESGALRWDVSHRVVRKLGSGGQGVVMLAERLGAFGVVFQLALKFFDPKDYHSTDAYRAEMSRLARLTMRLARLQEDHLLDVFNQVDCGGVNVLVMEWIDGYDLRFLLTPGSLEQVRSNSSEETWKYVNDVVATGSRAQVRLKPGVAIAILRDCLAALSALHHEQIVHGDLKPANIMVKRTGSCKLVDFGSAVTLDEPALRKTWTPRYASVEMLEGSGPSPASDLASLGYVLFEMLSGALPFADATTYAELIAEKRRLPEELGGLLPPDAADSELLLGLLQGLIAPDPAERFASADAADVSLDGAAAFQRQLVRGDLASEYERDIRLWVRELA